MSKKFFLTLFFLLLFLNSVFAETIKKINVSGNERISKETIILFGEIDLNEDFSEHTLNKILKNLYNTNFFEDIKIDITNSTLNVFVVENPIIQNVKIEGIKAKKLKDPIYEALKLKKNNSFNEYLMKKDRDLFLNILKSNGFYFAKVNIKKVENSNNTVSIIYNVDLGKRAKIRKIKFIGDKKYKNRKLFRIIASEEDKFWKFISSNKLLDQGRIELDVRLLGNFYLEENF